MSIQDYPVSLRLSGLKVAVIGGGFGTERRVRDLVATGAEVVLICPPDKVDEKVLPPADLLWLRRIYRAGDLRGVFLVISCPGDTSLAERVWQEAASRAILINTVDDTAHANFAFPAIHRQGDVTIAVSTGGKSPALAVALRDLLAAQVGPEYGAFLDLLAGVRDQVKQSIANFRGRLPVWKGLIASDALRLLRLGRFKLAEATLQQDLERLLSLHTPVQAISNMSEKDKV